jgi:hypothetical protein
VAVGDVNGDGKLDIAVANSGADGHWSLSVLLGHGDGTFGPAEDLPSGQIPSWIALADLNGDGKLDILTVDTSALGHGDGTFDDPVTPASWVGNSIVLGDIDGDGTLDVVTAKYPDTFSVWYGRGDGTFGAPKVCTLKTAGFALGDLNGDGLPDVVATKPDADSVFTLFGSCP